MTTGDARVRELPDLTGRVLFDIAVDLAEPLSFGSGPLGNRVLFRAAAGSFAGPRLRGEVVDAGGDWALFRADGVMTLDVRLSLRTHDGALIGMSYGGRWRIPAELRAELDDPARRHRIDPGRYYFRTNPLFETGAEGYAWLNDIVCVGSGYPIEGGVAYRVFEVI